MSTATDGNGAWLRATDGAFSRPVSSHSYELTTTLAVGGARIVVLAREMDCLCHCPLPEPGEALKAARAQARGEGAE